jgi:hypothetical protein
LQQETSVTAQQRVNLLESHRFARAKTLVALFICVVFSAPSASLCRALEVKPEREIAKLPAAVQRMRQAILQAATSGDIEQLRIPIEMNEIPPVFTKSRIGDPIAYLKAASGDGNGREMLAILYNLLTTGYAIVNPGGKDEMAVWPYHAVTPFQSLTPSQEVELYRFLPPAKLKEMITQGKYSFYKVGIGRDGVWHYFSAD